MPPRVSVMMATFNGAAYIGRSIASLLDQTMNDFELIIADDGSTDGTRDILAGIADPRLRVIRNDTNSGVVASRNACFAAARGAYVAMMDHDDLALPTRLAKQCAYLDAHPDVVLVGTLAHTIEDGRMGAPKHPGRTTPALIGWLLLVANPLICSSVMFRAEPARRLDQLMRPGFAYADDYDLYHRLAAFGRIGRIDEALTIYRLHRSNASRQHEAVMTGNAVRVLAPVYRAWIEGDAEEAATLIATHLAACKPVQDLETLEKLRRYLGCVTEAYVGRLALSPTEAETIRAQAAALYAGAVRLARRLSGLHVGAGLAELPGGRTHGSEGMAKLIRAFDGVVPPRLRAVARAIRDHAAPAPPGREVRAGGTLYCPAAQDRDDPPRLFVVVDTEAEFDWSKPFARKLTKVGAIRNVELGQAVFDRYGLRPLYVVDYPIATTQESIAAIDRIAQSGRCEIGAHLHPWTTPPYDEDVSDVNSYPGNLPAAIEAAKLEQLMAAIARGFGVRTVFYKAGRYGIGPNTPELLRQSGIKVDWSIMPGTDMSGHGGPDFRALEPRPYWLGNTGVLSMPMTRSRVGLAPWVGAAADRLLPARLSRTLPAQAALARARISDHLTLTPEGVTAAEQIRLVQTLLARGTRQFVLHYHSPSLEPGHTSYTRTAAELDVFIGRLAEVCAYFFETAGGVPGHPRSLTGCGAPGAIVPSC